MTDGARGANARVVLPVVEKGAGGAGPSDDAQAAAAPGGDGPVRDEDLPELCDEVIDADTLEALFADLRREAQVLSVTLKALGARRANAEEASLASAESALLRRAIAGAQVRYEYRGALWFDTLLARGEGFRIVRVRHELG